jgi:hypothetical protein
MLEALEKLIEQTLERTLRKFNLERQPEPPSPPPVNRKPRVRVESLGDSEPSNSFRILAHGTYDRQSGQVHWTRYDRRW